MSLRAVKVVFRQLLVICHSIRLRRCRDPLGNFEVESSTTVDDGTRGQVELEQYVVAAACSSFSYVLLVGHFRRGLAFPRRPQPGSNPDRLPSEFFSNVTSDNPPHHQPDRIPTRVRTPHIVFLAHLQP